MTNKVSASTFSFEKIVLTTPDGDAFDITEIVFGFSYYEDITKGYVSGNLRIIDSGFNIRATAPIHGYDLVEIVVNGPDEERYEMKFRTYRIGDVYMSQGKQTYNLGLISEEALLNEQLKVSKKFTGTPTEIVRKILSEYFEVDQLNADTTINKTVIVPNNKNPFTVCSMIADRSVTDTNTAGCFFFQNANGFQFRSIDTLCDIRRGDGREIRSFVESQNPSQTMQPFNILSIAFLSEVNLMEGLRMGAYSSELQMFNIDTGEVITKKFSLEDNFGNQKHLGSQDKLTKAQTMSAASPTRIASAIISNEVNYSGKKVASEDAEYKDWTDQLLLQSFSRNYILNTQGLRIEVPGNLDLVVGDRVNVILQNAVDTETREEEDSDTVNSGFYLITQLSRLYNKTNYNVTTVLKLQRDTYGAPVTEDVLLF